jgi:hypothetical protein
MVAFPITGSSSVAHAALHMNALSGASTTYTARPDASVT